MNFQHVIAFDTETCLIDRGEDLAPKLVCATYCSNEDHVPGIAKDDDVLSVLRGIAASDAVIVGANFAFDAWVILRKFPEFTEEMFALYDAGRIVDVQLNERLIDIARGQLDSTFDPNSGKDVQKFYSLAALHDAYGLGQLAKGEDTWRLRYSELMDVPLEAWPTDASSYAKDDALATLRVYEAQLQHKQWWQPDAAAQARGAFALRKVAIRGLMTDGPAVESYIKELEKLVLDSGDLLKEAGIVRSNGSKDTKKAKAHMLAVCAEHGIEPRVTDTAKKKKLTLDAAIAGGYISLDAEACRAVSFDELLTAYGVYSTSDSILTRAEALREGAKGLPLQSEMISLLANGRTATRIPKAPVVGVNLLNLPRAGALRACFVPRPGYVFVSVDFSADEIACFAQCELWMCGKSLMAEALRDGRDLHCEVAATMLGEPYEVVLANKAHGKYKRARQFAKIVGFGCLGAMSAKTLWKNANSQAKNLEDRMTLRQAQEAHAAWTRRWQVTPYFNAVKYALGRDSFNSVCTVRQFGSERIRGGLGYTDACNTLFSGLAADGNKDALYQCVKAAALAKPGSPFYDTHMVAHIHDENFGEIPEATATESATAICELMLATKRKWCPDVPAKAEAAIMRRWYKAAQQVWSPDGELLAWTPEMGGM
jgi:hypothetical protein